MNKMLLSGNEELVDEFTEVCRGNVRHKGTLKRKYVKRKGEGYSYILRLTFSTVIAPPTTPLASTHSREPLSLGLGQ